jgi:3',5'-cyclic AMP phosphodiesterase CpdA
MRILQISDTHLSRRHRHFADNAAILADWVRAQKPDLIINSGDASMDGAMDHDDLRYTAEWHASLGAPVLTAPGNHDVGDIAAIRPDQLINDARLTAWREIVGPDRWTHDFGDWRLIGLNGMLLGSDHPEEAAQDAWLAEALNCDRQIAVFLHKPLFIDDPAEPPRGYWTVLPEPRRRLINLFASAKVKMVASGHLHGWRQEARDGVAYVWAPSGAFVVGEMQEDLGSVRRLGAVEHVFADEGVATRFLRVEGQQDLLIDPVVREIYPTPAKTEA